jgi:hypothetical protein
MRTTLPTRACVAQNGNTVPRGSWSAPKSTYSNNRPAPCVLILFEGRKSQNEIGWDQVQTISPTESGRWVEVDCTTTTTGHWRCPGQRHLRAAHRSLPARRCSHRAGNAVGRRAGNHRTPKWVATSGRRNGYLIRLFRRHSPRSRQMLTGLWTKRREKSNDPRKFRLPKSPGLSKERPRRAHRGRVFVGCPSTAATPARLPGKDVGRCAGMHKLMGYKSQKRVYNGGARLCGGHTGTARADRHA